MSLVVRAETISSLKATPMNHKKNTACVVTRGAEHAWCCCQQVRSEGLLRADWQPAEAHLKTRLLVLLLPLLSLQPTAKEELLAAGHVVQTAPNFFSHQKTMGKGMSGQVIVPVPVLAVMWWCYARLYLSHNDTNPTAAGCLMQYFFSSYSGHTHIASRDISRRQESWICSILPPEGPQHDVELKQNCVLAEKSTLG